MTDRVEVRFKTDKPAEVPKVGARKTVRVNGRPEVLWCRSVEVKAERYAPGEVNYSGIATYTRDLWS